MDDNTQMPGDDQQPVTPDVGAPAVGGDAGDLGAPAPEAPVTPGVEGAEEGEKPEEEGAEPTV